MQIELILAGRILATGSLFEQTHLDVKYSLPLYTKTITFFTAGEHLANGLQFERRTGQLADCFLQEYLIQSSPDPLYHVLICETIADSIGHPCWDRPWNIYLNQWLYTSGFVASPQLVLRAIESITVIQKKGNLSRPWLIELDGLLRRLRSEPSPTKRPNPHLSKAAYKKLAIGFQRNSESFGENKSNLSIYNPTIDRAIEATALYPKSISGINSGFSGEPSVEDQIAIQILFYRFREHVDQIRCDAQIGRGEPITQLSFDFWHNLMPQIRNMLELDLFESRNLYVSEEDILTILALPKLRILRVSSSEEKLKRELKFHEQLIETAIKKKTLLVLDLPNLSEDLIQRVESSDSRPMLQVNGRQVVARRGRGSKCQ